MKRYFLIVYGTAALFVSSASAHGLADVFLGEIIDPLSLDSASQNEFFAGDRGLAPGRESDGEILPMYWSLHLRGGTKKNLLVVSTANEGKSIRGIVSPSSEIPTRLALARTYLAQCPASGAVVEE